VTKANRAIEIDPKYEKAYYRRMQIYQDLKQLELAVKSVPSWVQNKEMDELLKAVREEYFNSLGLDELLEGLINGKDISLDTAKEGHLKFYYK
jgi:hypothetical protein